MSLATNWRVLTGGNNYICSRSGNDANIGNAEFPVRSLQNNFSGTRYLRGIFPFTANISPVSDTRLVGDGLTVVLGGGFTITTAATNNIDLAFINIQFFNTDLDVRNSADSSRSDIENCTLNSCIFEIKGQSASIRQSNFFGNLIIDSIINEGIYTPGATFKNTFINSEFNLTGQYQYTAFFNGCRARSGNKNFFECAFAPDTLFGSGSDELQNATLSGDSDTIGNTYSEGQKFSGTATIGGRNCSFTNCFYTADPKFTNELAGDYTLKASSLLLNNFAVIGSKSSSVQFDSQSPAFDPLNAGVSYTDAIRNVDGSFTFNDPVGTVVSTNDPLQCLTLPFPTTVNNAIGFFGSFLYNQGDWLDTENYDAGINDEVRLTVRVQIYDENDPNGANSPLNFSDWILIEINTPIEVDDLGLGNGNVNANMQQLQALTFERFRIELVGRTNGV